MMKKIKMYEKIEKVRDSDKDILMALVGSSAVGMNIGEMRVGQRALDAIEKSNGELVMTGDEYKFIMERFDERRFRVVSRGYLDLYDRLLGASDYEMPQAIKDDVSGNPG